MEIIMDDYDITNDIYIKRERSLANGIRALFGACLMILAIGIPFAIYFWRM
jgi:hypothetical protein